MIDLKQLLNDYEKNSNDMVEFRKNIQPLLRLVSRLSVIKDLIDKCQEDISSIPDVCGIQELKDKLNTLDWVNEYDANKTEEMLRNV